MCINARAQKAFFEVDNQMPGWLSSKIPYEDQRSISNLRVTGYINSEDIQFITSLIGQRNLHGVLDLSDVNIVGETADKDDVLAGKFVCGTLSNSGKLQKFVLPKTLIDIDWSSFLYFNVDSVICDTNIKTFKRKTIGDCKYVYVNGSVEQINSYAFGNSSNSMLDVVFGDNNKIKELNDFTVENMIYYDKHQSKVVFPELEYLGYHAYFTASSANLENLPDTFLFPIIKEFHVDGVKLRPGMHVYLGDDLTKVYRSPKVSYSSKTEQDVTGVIFHLSSLTPPSTRTQPYWTKGLIVYVPKQAVDAYKNDAAWKYATIYANPEPVENIILDTHELDLNIGDERELSASILPDYADNKGIIWVSDNENVAKVDSYGKVKAIGGGKTMIWAMSEENNAIKEGCQINVYQPVTGVELNTTEVSLEGIGKSITLNATILPENASNRTITWRSSDEAVCMVSNGKVVALGYGTAVIIVTTEDGGHIATCIVTVENTSGIESTRVQDSVKLYDVTGRAILSQKKGVNILKKSDGKVLKQVIK